MKIQQSSANITHLLHQRFRAAACTAAASSNLLSLSAGWTLALAGARAPGCLPWRLPCPFRAPASMRQLRRVCPAFVLRDSHEHRMLAASTTRAAAARSAGQLRRGEASGEPAASRLQAAAARGGRADTASKRPATRRGAPSAVAVGNPERSLELDRLSRSRSRSSAAGYRVGLCRLGALQLGAIGPYWGLLPFLNGCRPNC